GYVQGNLTRKYGKIKGFIWAIILYTSIHVATGNLVLILAALAGGIFWGWMYMRYRSILMNSVSHVIWDIAVFLIFPFSS
ncbi:MAG: CPBP family intramembrane glutamic endopeptidase, partial [Bacteroidota bacterium]